jgi:ethanolamine utilization protein EutN
VILGRVVGFVWATRKDARLVQAKLVVVEPYGWYNPPQELGHVVAVDSLDAGPHDDVVVCLGAPARWQLGGINLPVEAAVMAIVDRCDLARRELERTRPMRFLPGTAPRHVEWLA